MTALDEAGITVVNAETGAGVLGEDGAVDLDCSLAMLGDEAGAGVGAGGDEEDEFVPASAVFGGGAGAGASAVGGAVYAPAPPRAAKGRAPAADRPEAACSAGAAGI